MENIGGGPPRRIACAVDHPETVRENPPKRFGDSTEEVMNAQAVHPFAGCGGSHAGVGLVRTSTRWGAGGRGRQPALYSPADTRRTSRHSGNLAGSQHR